MSRPNSSAILSMAARVDGSRMFSEPSYASWLSGDGRLRLQNISFIVAPSHSPGEGEHVHVGSAGGGQRVAALAERGAGRVDVVYDDHAPVAHAPAIADHERARHLGEARCRACVSERARLARAVQQRALEARQPAPPPPPWRAPH